MALNAFLLFPGAPGSSRQKHVRNWIVVHSVRRESTRDPIVELLAGKPSRQQCLVVTKEVDQASPKLHELLHSAKKTDFVTLNFWQLPPRGGREELFYSMVLKGAQVRSIRTRMLNVRRPENALSPEQEDVSLVFDGVTHSVWIDGKQGPEVTVDTVDFELPYREQLLQVGMNLARIAASALVDGFKVLTKAQPDNPPQTAKPAEAPK